MLKTTITAGILAGSLLFSACGAPQPRYATVDAHRGMAYETARFSHIMYPDAARTAPSIEGIDGRVADSINKKYQDDFKVKTPPTPVIKLDLGTGK